MCPACLHHQSPLHHTHHEDMGNGTISYCSSAHAWAGGAWTGRLLWRLPLGRKFHQFFFWDIFSRPLIELRFSCPAQLTLSSFPRRSVYAPRESRGVSRLLRTPAALCIPVWWDSPATLLEAAALAFQGDATWEPCENWRRWFYAALLRSYQSQGWASMHMAGCAGNAGFRRPHALRRWIGMWKGHTYQHLRPLVWKIKPSVRHLTA